MEVFEKNGNAFFYKASKAKFGFEKVPVGINTLNKVLPDLCEAAGVKTENFALSTHQMRLVSF